MARIIEENADNITLYRIRCKDRQCNKLIEYKRSDYKKGNISSGGGRCLTPYFGFSCPDCSEVYTEAYLKLHGKKVGGFNPLASFLSLFRGL